MSGPQSANLLFEPQPIYPPLVAEWGLPNSLSSLGLPPFVDPALIRKVEMEREFAHPGATLPAVTLPKVTSRRRRRSFPNHSWYACRWQRLLIPRRRMAIDNSDVLRNACVVDRDRLSCKNVSMHVKDPQAQRHHHRKDFSEPGFLEPRRPSAGWRLPQRLSRLVFRTCGLCRPHVTQPHEATFASVLDII